MEEYHYPRIISFINNDVEPLTRFLAQHGQVMFVNDVKNALRLKPDLLVLPSVNAFSFADPEVVNNGDYHGMLSISSIAQKIRENIGEIIKLDIPVIAFGQSSSILWSTFGGELQISNESMITGMVGEIEPELDWPNKSLFDRNRHEFTYRVPFYQTVELSREFKLINKGQTVYPIAWETAITKTQFHQITSKMSTTGGLSNGEWNNRVKGNICGFAHISNKFFGLTYSPEKIHNREQSMTYRRYGYAYGDKLANRLIDLVLNNNRKKGDEDDQNQDNSPATVQ